MPRTSKLSSPSPELVLNILRKNIGPLRAYEVLEKAHKFGIKSPPIVYRALDSLIEMGKVHKINELNSFIACNCDDDHEHSLTVLTVCQNCSKVSEIHDHSVIDHLIKLKNLDVNLAKQAVIQLPVICSKCSA